MAFHLYLILIPLTLLAVFLGLVAYEERAGQRVLFPRRRYLLDQKASRAAFIVQHVDWGAFFNDITRTSFERLAHDVAHTTLIFVRALERELTRLVRTLRARREQPLFPARTEEKPSRIESTITHLKKTVRRSRKQPVAAIVERADEA